MIRIVIVDEQTVLKESLRYYIEQESELKVVGSGANEKEAIELCRKLLPDILLVDIRVFDCRGIEEIRLIKEVHKTIKIIILTSCKDEKIILNALEYGVEGYLFKDVEPKMITMAIQSVYYGVTIFHKNILSILTKKTKLLNKSLNKSLYEDYYVDKNILFSKRELSILKGITNGKSNNDIAQEIYLSKGRVANIITNLFEKTNLNDRTQLAVFAVKNNLV